MPALVNKNKKKTHIQTYLGLDLHPVHRHCRCREQTVLTTAPPLTAAPRSTLLDTRSDLLATVEVSPTDVEVEELATMPSCFVRERERGMADAASLHQIHLARVIGLTLH